MADYYSLSDIQLLHLLRRSDAAAFTEIYKRYWEFLYKSSFSILKDCDISDDIVQDIFVWLWSNREKHLTDSLKPYLYTAVKYKVANVIRHGKVKEIFFEKVVQNYQEAEVDPNNLEVKELKEVIAQFTSNLPERARMIFDLSRNKLLSNKEIAEQLGISEKTVENQMNISLKKLKISLGRMSFWSTLI